jgi:hypothetical protein
MDIHGNIQNHLHGSATKRALMCYQLYYESTFMDDYYKCNKNDKKYTLTRIKQEMSEHIKKIQLAVNNPNTEVWWD